MHLTRHFAPLAILLALSQVMTVVAQPGITLAQPGTTITQAGITLAQAGFTLAQPTTAPLDSWLLTDGQGRQRRAGAELTDFANILRIEPITPPERRAGNPAHMTLALRDGQRLPGTPDPSAPGTSETLLWNIPGIGTFSIPLASVESVQTPGAPLPTGSDADAKDFVQLRNGDRLFGVVTGVSADGVLLQAEAGDPTLLPWAGLRSLRLAATAPASAGPRAGFRVELSGGIVLHADALKLFDTAVRLVSPLTPGEVLVPASEILRIEPLGQSYWPLTLLRPVKVEHTPYLTARRPVGFDTAHDGGELRLAGRSYARGLALTSRTRLTYRAPEGFNTLRITYGLAPEAATGQAIFRVYSQGSLVHESSVLTTPAETKELTVNINGEFSVECDFAGSEGVLSRVVVVDPVLTR
jgi:hypothetical protein